jgi:hypothetical protein
LSKFRIVNSLQKTLKEVQNYQFKATVQEKNTAIKPFYTSLDKFINK